MEILELLGRGGMGILYKAREAATGRMVALKILPPEKAVDPQFGGRFAREAKALQSLTHPNIVDLYEFGVERDLYFLAMEFVAGLTLRQYQGSRKLPLAEARPIVTQICDALEYAHALGVVHRDIKPENLLLDTAGHLKLTDFGLAKLRGGEMDGLTDTFTHLGTADYRAPEQLSDPKGVDHRADIYATGVVLYEMLSGSVPVFGGEPSFEPGIERLLRKALAADPEGRYPTIGEFRNEFLRAAGVA